jgi:type I restriction enzyme M protein
MLTDTTLRSAVEALWDKLWSGGLANPLDAIEQLSFLLFLKRLAEREQDAERAAKLRGKKFTPNRFRCLRRMPSISPASTRKTSRD